MPRLLPSFKMGPFASIIWWAFLALVVLTLLFGGAGPWASGLFLGVVALALLVLYVAVRRGWDAIVGV